MSPEEVEARIGEALVELERHVNGALGAIADLRALKAAHVVRELRVSGTLASVRSLRVFVGRERKARS